MNLLAQRVASIEQLDVKEPHVVNESIVDEAEDDEHFGGGTASAVIEPGLSDPEEGPPPYTEEELAEVGDITYPAPDYEAVRSSGLKCPIVIPQRRPGSKTRGFIRAYAPVLSEYDIDQETFLIFLKSFHKASQVCLAILQRCHSSVALTSTLLQEIMQRLTMMPR